jgi:hypothetical protein
VQGASAYPKERLINMLVYGLRMMTVLVFQFPEGAATNWEGVMGQNGFHRFRLVLAAEEALTDYLVPVEN